jgi:hypothetical protein
LCVLKDNLVRIGEVTEIQHDKIQIAYAIKNMKVAIKIDCATSNHFNLNDQLVSIITRESIDACKDHFRDDLDRDCWKLMRDLKTVFKIRDPAPVGAAFVESKVPTESKNKDQTDFYLPTASGQSKRK